MYSFFYPVESDFWLIKNGFLILIIEFFSLFIIVFLSDFWQERQSRSEHKTIHPLVGLCAVLLMTSIIIIVFNPLLLLYFLVSIGVKFFRFRSETSRSTIAMNQVYSVIFLVLSAFATLLFSQIMLSFSDQIIAYRSFFESLPGKMSGAVVDNPGFIAMWGFFYFIFLSIFELCRSARKKKIIVQ